MALIDQEKYELEMIKTADSRGAMRNGAYGGVRTPIQSEPIAKPEILYKDLWLEGDLYQEDGKLLLILICPRCMNQITIPAESKRIDWDQVTGKLSVEPFECTWELDNQAPVGTHKFGTNLCRWRVGIEKNRALDAQR